MASRRSIGAMSIDDVAREKGSRSDGRGFLLLIASLLIAVSVTFPSVPIRAIGEGPAPMLVFSLVAIFLALCVLVASLRGVTSDGPRRWVRWVAAGISGLSLVPALQYLTIGLLRMAT